MALMPNSPAPISPRWLNRGVNFIHLGNGHIWTKARGWTRLTGSNGAPKTRPGKFGQSLGFGATFGGGTTDRIDGPEWTTSTEYRSIVAFCFANGFGGSGSGRIFNGAGTSGVTSQEESMFVSNVSGREMTYTHVVGSTGQWYLAGSGTGIELGVWNCYGVSHDCTAPGIAPLMFKNGVSGGVGTVSSTSSAYSKRTAVMNLGNRSSDNARCFDGMHGPFIMFDSPHSYLSEAEHAEISADPTILFVQRRKVKRAFEVAASNELASNITVTFGSSANLTGISDGLSSSDNVAFGENATLTGSGALAGSVTVAFGENVTLSTGIVVDDSYERSSINVPFCSISGVGDSAIISLQPRYGENETIGTRWMEPSARITGVNGIRPTIRFLDYASGLVNGYPWPTSRRMMYSYDRLTWTYFDTSTQVGGSHIDARNTLAFTGNQIYVSRSRQISSRQFGQFIEDIAALYAFISPPAVAVAFTPTAATTGFPAQDYIVNEFSTQIDELGRTVPQTPYYGMVIDDTSLMPPTGSKTAIVFELGMHAGEDLGDWACLRTIEEICSNSTYALILRRFFKFYIFGFSNAPGRDGGNWRSGFTQGTGGTIDDGNRHFSDANPGLESVTIPRTAMLTELAGVPIAAIFPWHGSYLNSWAHFANITIETAHAALIQSYSGFSLADEGTQHAGSVGTWGQNTLGATISNTMEFGDLSPKSDADYVTYAQAWVRATAEIFVGGLASAITVTFGENSTLSMNGDISSSVTLTLSETASLAGIGELAATDSFSFTPNVLIQASGALVATGNIAFSTSGVLTGSGALAATASVVFTENAFLNSVGDGSMASSITLTFDEGATLTGTGALSAASNVVFSESANLVSSAGLASSIIINFGDVSTLSGTGALLATDTLQFAPGATLVGTGALESDVTVLFTDDVTLSGLTPGLNSHITVNFTTVGTLIASGALASDVSILFVDNVALVANGLLASDVTVQFSPNVTLTGKSPVDMSRQHYIVVKYSDPKYITTVSYVPDE